MNFATIKAIRGPLQHEVLKQLIADAAEDDHIVHSATHLIYKEGELAGYFSLGVIPTGLCWFSTKKMKAHDSANVITAIENQCALDPRIGSMMTPVSPTSPFHPHMEKLGYKKYYNADIFIKDIYGHS